MVPGSLMTECPMLQYLKSSQILSNLSDEEYVRSQLVIVDD